MAKRAIHVQTKQLVESLKQGQLHPNKLKVLNEDLNSQILLAMEVREAARKSRDKRAV
ncbi:MAG: hypothetical protein WDM80_02325 [Limisphaerales bacterium]